MIVIRIFKNELKIITLFSIVFILFIPTTLVFAGVGNHGLPEYIWKRYPYHPPGTDITFPYDEGVHDVSDFPIEWWYANFNLTGQLTGNRYGSFVAFYEVGVPGGTLEVRLLSISDIAEVTTYTNVEKGDLIGSDDHLNLTFEYRKGLDSYPYEFSPDDKQMDCSQFDHGEISKGALHHDTQKGISCSPDITDYIKENPVGVIQKDHWYTKTNDSGLIPFQYHMTIGGDSHQDSQPMELSVDMDCFKRPLMASGDGKIDLPEDTYSFYYSLTRLNVTGTITVHNLTEEVSGEAWIDHQWGDFISMEPPGLTCTYEWFSIKLDDNREIMVGDVWNRTGAKLNQSFSNGLNLLNSDGSLELIEDYTITQLEYWNWTSGSHHRQFASKWNMVELSKPINLTITPIYPDQVMCIADAYPLLKEWLLELLPAAAFWEGACAINGTIAGVPVTGNAYVELTHSYDEDDGLLKNL